MLNAHRDAAAAFAATQGWTVPVRDYRPSRLVRDASERRNWPDMAWGFRDDVFEHPFWLLDGQRNPVVVVHLYHRLAIDRLPPSIVVDRLPASWYYPQRTTAFVYRPAAHANEGFA